MKYFLPGLLFSGLCVFSQEYRLSGKIADEQGNPLEGTDIVLLDTDTKKNTRTDSAGRFNLQAQAGSYTLEARFFQQKHEQSLRLEKDTDLGTIILKSIALKEINVTGKKKQVFERKADRLVYNILDASAAQGQNAWEALSGTPGVTVDEAKSNVSIIGKNTVQVYINDRILRMTGEELKAYLSSLPIAQIEKIEIITNPPARYEAEGNSGIIRIVTKTAHHPGWYGNLQTSYSRNTYGTGRNGLLLNYRNSRWEISATLNYTKGAQKAEENSITRFSQRRSEGRSLRKGSHEHYGYELDATYKINDHHSLGVGYRGGLFYPTLVADNQNRFYTPENRLDETSLTDFLTKIDHSRNLWKLHYDWKIDKKQTFNVNIDLLDSRTRRTETSDNRFLDSTGAETKREKNRNSGKQDIALQSISADYNLETDFGRLEAGAKYTRISRQSDFRYSLNGNIDPSKSNAFDYDENISALYLSANKKLEKWEFQLGLRGEYTLINANSKQMNQKIRYDYFPLFPTAYITYNPEKKHDFSLNYGRRIQRPPYDYLNPFRWYIYPNMYSVGNPDLRPAFAHNFELNYLYNRWLSVGLYYNLTADFIQRNLYRDDTKEETFITPQNTGTNASWGTNLYAKFNPIGFWEIIAEASAYQTQFKALYREQKVNERQWSGNFKIKNSWTLNPQKTLFAGLDFSYQFPGFSGFNQWEGINDLGLSLKALLWEKKLTLSIQAHDLLKGVRSRGKSRYAGEQVNNYYDYRSVVISLSYNFGNDKNKLKQRASKIKDEETRGR